MYHGVQVKFTQSISESHPKNIYKIWFIVLQWFVSRLYTLFCTNLCDKLRNKKMYSLLLFVGTERFKGKMYSCYKSIYYNSTQLQRVVCDSVIQHFQNIKHFVSLIRQNLLIKLSVDKLMTWVLNFHSGTQNTAFCMSNSFEFMDTFIRSWCFDKENKCASTQLISNAWITTIILKFG